MKIIPLSEGSFTIDKSKLFVPFNEETDKLQQRPAGSLLVEVQPFVIITTEDVLLLDTGLGFTNADGGLQLHENLRKAGIDPATITKVLLSHLHKDHAGGAGIENKTTGEINPSFPAATYYVQEKELEYAFEKGFPSFITEELKFLKGNIKLELLKGNGILNGYIKYEVTAAHSPFHQVFTIVDGGETVFFGADDAPQLHQMKTRFVAKYDFDGKKCMELRRQWWEKGHQEHWRFLFYHDIKTPEYKA
jgi:glyoxylase-like metal-dependent hydrolase (beta-lactamase superfamily II)